MWVAVHLPCYSYIEILDKNTSCSFVKLTNCFQSVTALH